MGANGVRKLRLPRGVAKGWLLNLSAGESSRVIVYFKGRNHGHSGIVPDPAVASTMYNTRRIDPTAGAFADLNLKRK